MRIQIKTKDLDLTPAMKQFIEEKVGSLQKFVQRYDENDALLVEVEIARSTNHHHKGEVFYAELNLALPKKVLRAEDENFDARTAVNNAKDKLQREIDKYKDIKEQR